MNTRSKKDNASSQDEISPHKATQETKRKKKMAAKGVNKERRDKDKNNERDHDTKQTETRRTNMET